jgi:hypothetical protein
LGLEAKNQLCRHSLCKALWWALYFTDHTGCKMKPFASFVLLFALSCESDKVVGVRNSIPEVTITSHSEGDRVYAGQVVEFRAAVSDSNNEPASLLSAWYAGGREICPMLPPASDGNSICAAVINADEDIVSVEVHDDMNATGSAAVRLDVVASDPPVAQVTAPTPEGGYYSDQKIAFSGTVSDTEDAPEDLLVTWISDLDGAIETDAEADSNGEIFGSAYLSEGEHFISLQAEDTSGQTASDSVAIVVGPPNSGPECAITAPVDGGASVVGELVRFEAQVSDLNILSDQLDVVWESDKDGSIGTSTPSSVGEVVFAYDALSVNTHTVSMTVSDEVGATCTDLIVYTVGTPPTIVLDTPLGGEDFDVGEPIPFSAMVSDGEDLPSLLSLEWYSDLDGVFSTHGANSLGVSQFANSTLSPGAHNITATVTDSTGLYSDALVSITVNALPTQPTVSISPVPVYTDDDLTASATGSTDADGDAVSYSFEWFDGGSSSGHTSAVLSSAYTSKGDSWTVQVTPSDGISSGPFGEATVIVLNTSPEVSSVSIAPSSPGVQDILTCSASVDDPDETPSISYDWTDGDAAHLGSGPSLDLATLAMAGGDAVTCTVIAEDGDGDVDSSSASVVVINNLPEVTVLNLSPHSAYTNDLLSAAAAASDADGHATTLSFYWYVDSGTGAQLVQSGSSAQLDGTVLFDKHDMVHVEVVPNDGFEDGPALGSSVLTVLNTLPEATVSITPASPVAGQDELTCIVSTYDEDMDSVGLTYTWTVDGVLSPHTAEVVPAWSTSSGEEWVCEVIPNDGDEDGNASSAAVTIDENDEGKEGLAFCAGGGLVSSGNFSGAICISGVDLAPAATSSNSSFTWQPGPTTAISP